jgi:prevent-host-death family protein
MDCYLVASTVAIYRSQMAISVSKFKNSCLDVIRRVEATGQSVSITRRGKVVARLAPSFQATQSVDAKPWQQLRALGGELLAEPSESVVREHSLELFKPLRLSDLIRRIIARGGPKLRKHLGNIYRNRFARAAHRVLMDHVTRNGKKIRLRTTDALATLDAQ